MKNKQNAARRKHGILIRRVQTRELRKRFLLICEGTKTEPKYFRMFRVNISILDIEIDGRGDNTETLVKEALKRKQEEEFDQVWCIFDRDSFPTEKFNNAITLAKKNGIQVAYSNEAFELWYLLHFNYYDASTSRREYPKMLSKLLGFKYIKNCDNMYEVLIDKQLTAIKNAEKLLKSYDQHNPAYDNPSTTVHLLVKELNKYII